MEEVAKVQVSSSLEIDGMDSMINEQDPELQPETIMPTDDELDGALLFQGDMPAPNEPMSPGEHCRLDGEAAFKAHLLCSVVWIREFEKVLCYARNHAWHSAGMQQVGARQASSIIYAT